MENKRLTIMLAILLALEVLQVIEKIIELIIIKLVRHLVIQYHFKVMPVSKDVLKMGLII